MESAEIAVLGNGPVAQSLVLALGEYGVSCILVDTRPATAHAPDSSVERTVALALGSRRLLDGLGVRLGDPGAGAIGRVQISQAGAGPRVELSHRLLQAPEKRLGEVWPLPVLSAAIAQTLQERGTIAAQPWGPLQGFSWHPDHVQLRWPGRQVRARLVVLADGGHGHLGPLLGLQRRGWDHNRHALIARVRVASEPQGERCAYEHFLASGPLAFLPVEAPREFSLVWSLYPSQAAALLYANDFVFLQKLNAVRPQGLAAVTEVRNRGFYPLHFQQYLAAPETRVALLGNAAQTLHPLAGQGYNLGLRDSVTLAALLRETLERGEDPGGTGVLQDFQRIRRRDRLEIIAFTEGMNRLFGIDLTPLHLLRAAGLAALQWSPTVKTRLAARLAGLRLPVDSSIPDLDVENAAHARS
ncbi:FAD-dependent monooxygenase [Acidithiobacillus sp.]|uniref:FAD-dependent monooxygenase n=1 Tax=Acidithiobacillus sp. TaxID=1872118 RepID=UPI0025BA1F24|nr:FAD-dependent monooxygenase [Acidithiobacillus sp.]